MIKITDILNDGHITKGSWMKDGKPIPFDKLLVNGNVDGDTEGEACVLKCFKVGHLASLKVGDSVECGKPYNNKDTGYAEYSIKAPKKSYGGGGYNSVNYTREEFDKLFLHAVKCVSDLPKEVRNTSEGFCHALVSTYLIGAQKGGVKII